MQTAARHLVLFLMMTLLAACGRADFGTPTSGGEVVDSDVERDVPLPDESDRNDGLVDDANGPAAGGDPLDDDEANAPQFGASPGSDFAFSVYHELAARGRNAVFAPHGLARSLVILHAAGAVDERFNPVWWGGAALIATAIAALLLSFNRALFAGVLALAPQRFAASRLLARLRELHAVKPQRMRDVLLAQVYLSRFQAGRALDARRADSDLRVGYSYARTTHEPTVRLLAEQLWNARLEEPSQAPASQTAKGEAGRQGGRRGRRRRGSSRNRQSG